MAYPSERVFAPRAGLYEARRSLCFSLAQGVVFRRALAEFRLGGAASGRLLFWVLIDLNLGRGRYLGVWGARLHGVSSCCLVV